ncbi:MAG: TraR/DksA C4-type zinc finger protein [Nitrospirota bacterium]
MNLEHFRMKLLEKQQECQTAVAAFETEARVAGKPEVRDYTDAATVSEGVSEALEEGSIVSQTLEEVQDALRRVENGAYGKCIVCGRAIDPVRLEAVPWAARCIEDQEAQDKATPQLHAGESL